MTKLIIIGGSDAGISAALRAKELDPRITPTVIVADEYPNFSICGLPYYISHEVKDWKDLAHRTVQQIEEAGIKLLLGRTAKSVDMSNRLVTIVDTSGTVTHLEYNRLILGTGALSMRPPIAGIDESGVFLLRTIPDGRAIEQFLTLHTPKSAVIVGGGYIGMEMCEALTTRGISVTVVEFTDSVMTSIDSDFGKPIRETLVEHGVSVHTGIGIDSISGESGRLLVKGTNGFGVPADIVIVAVGAIPNTALGTAMGIATGIKGAFKVNRRMETNIPDVYAAGDCVETWHRILQKNTYLPLGTVAHKQGRVAGENAAGCNAEFAGALGTQSVKIFDRVVARTGLNEREAQKEGFRPVTADIETWDHKVYYPAAQKLHIRVTADRQTRRILGAQIIGAHGTEVSKRIDTFAAAIYHEATVDAFLEYDLSYTPPLSSPWDPVQLAVEKLLVSCSFPLS
ncbi:MAG TPA: FAD-dependent oxidoreductase [Syntrophorhabdaceae bacterium]|nr:FAD-dependent oxidoreductase [Syntrophorhabdaceae bacterium]